MNFNSTLSSSLPSGAIDSLDAAFHVKSSQQQSLPVAIFLVGYIFGPLVMGPISESYGRRICFIFSFGLHTAFTLGCALTSSWPLLLFFRFLVGLGASAPQAVLSGMYSDLYADLVPRGRAVMVLGLTSNIGPLIGPIIAGFSSTISWRWMFWISLIMSAANWPMLLLLPETFLPVILQKVKTEESSLEKDQKRTAPVKTGSWKQIITVVLTRPIRMFTEPLVLFTDLFLLYQYSILYLYFEAYPLIFKGTYNMTSGEAACMLLPIGVGALVAVLIFLWYDRFQIRSKLAGKPWAQRDEYRRLPLACAGGPLYAISQFWLAWTARPDVHWSIPALSGIPYGIGIDLTFMALNNYITDVYGIYSASAQASSVLSRNISAALLLPLATSPMYDHLGVGWACSLLGFVCAALSPIPFLFLRYGPALRARSPFCRKLRLKEEQGRLEEVAAEI
ncbi:hypothetical protein MMC21_001273 [Puttea exsequens]|nr:hypothetical protein [Puttea exsequens]